MTYPDPVTLVVLLYLESDGRDDYERFEREAGRIMHRHGGRIERRVALDRDESGPASDIPDEVHVVTFPDAARFQAYRADPDLTRFSELRERAISRTVVWSGADAPFFE